VQSCEEKRRKLGRQAGKAVHADTRSSLIPVVFPNSLHEKKKQQTEGRKEGRKKRISVVN